MVAFTAPETIAQILKLELPGVLATQPGLLISLKVSHLRQSTLLS